MNSVEQEPGSQAIGADVGEGAARTGCIEVTVEDLPRAFQGAYSGLLASPASETRWLELEQLAAQEQNPELVAKIYLSFLESRADADTFNLVAKRCASFHEEWFGEEADRQVDVLTRIIDLHASTFDWALDRITPILTDAERWEELFALYDRALENAPSEERREYLLEEAGQCAKDFAGRLDKATAYLSELLAIRPSDGGLALSLERLLEQQKCWNELVVHWRSRLPFLSDSDRLHMRLRMVDLLHNNIGDKRGGLTELEAMLGDQLGGQEVASRLERLIADADAEVDLRLRTAGLLKGWYDACDEAEQVVRVIEAALGFADGEERVGLHREAAERLVASGKNEQALAHYAELMRLQPLGEDARDHLRTAAADLRRFDVFIGALVTAADACEVPKREMTLRTEAAEISLESLNDRETATREYSRVLQNASHDPELGLVAARRLTRLFAERKDDAQRLDTLEQLATLEPHISDRQAALSEAARLAEKLGDPGRALLAWRARLEEDPTDERAADAIVDILEREQRWEPLVEALRQRSETTSSEWQRRADLKRIAAIQETRLASPMAAVATWLRFVELFQADGESYQALARLYEATEQWKQLGELLTEASGHMAQELGDVLVHLGDVRRTRLDDPLGATEAYGRALVAEPGKQKARAGMSVLTRDERSRGPAVTALVAALERTEDWSDLLRITDLRVAEAKESRQSVEILRQAARLLEEEEGDLAGAFERYAQALVELPDSRELEDEVLRLAEATEQQLGAIECFDACASQLTVRLESTETEADRMRLQQRIVSLRCRQARLLQGRPGRLEDAVNAYTAALEQTPQDLEIANLVVESAVAARLPDKAVDAFKQVVLQLNESPAMLELLARAQREAGDSDLSHTLERLSLSRPDDYRILREAVEIELAQDERSERVLALSLRLLDALRGVAFQEGNLNPDRFDAEVRQHMQWALERALPLLRARGKAEFAIRLLIDAAAMPFSAADRVRCNKLAAEIAEQDLDSPERAISLLETAFHIDDSDAESIDRLARLYDSQRRDSDLLKLQHHQVGLASEASERLALRLDISRLVDRLEASGGRVAALQANLIDEPGHAQSLDILDEVLRRQGKHALLASTYEEQADVVVRSNRLAYGSQLWLRAAQVYERDLVDADKALASYLRAAELDQNLEAFESLARIYGEAGDLDERGIWLERCLTAADDTVVADYCLELTANYIARQRQDRAISALEAIRERVPQDARLRDSLAELYRDACSWHQLIHLLAESARLELAGERAKQWLDESIHIAFETLRDPAVATEAVRLSLQLEPERLDLRVALAMSLAASNELDQARTLLEEIVAGFGRRQGHERAGVHRELAVVLERQGDIQGAMRELELATKMDRDDSESLRVLARLSRRTGDLERAERALRSLLMAIRRTASVTNVHGTEVVFELYEVANEQGDEQQATELLNSSLEAAAHSEDELERFSQLLLPRGLADLVMKACEIRLASVSDGESQGQVYIRMARILDEHMQQPQAAMDKWFEAMFRLPGLDEVHLQSRQLAKRQDALSDYAERLQSLVSRFQRREDRGMIADIKLQLASLFSEELGDDESAMELYREVESSGVRAHKAQFRLARLLGRRGSVSEQRRLLESVLSDEHEVEESTRAEAMFALGEIDLQPGEDTQRGISALREALKVQPDYKRACAALHRAAELDPDNAELAAVYLHAVRQSKNDELQLRYYRLRAAQRKASQGELRDAIDIAGRLGRAEVSESLLLQVIELAEHSSTGPAAARWAMMALSEHLRERGDIAQALSYFSQAVRYAEPFESKSLKLKFAELASEPGGDEAMALQTLQEMLDEYPEDEAVWRPLAQIYIKLERYDALQSLVERGVSEFESEAARNSLRLLWARHLSTLNDQQSATVRVLKEVLAEAPDNEEAAGLLMEVYEKSGYNEDLVELLEGQLQAAKAEGDRAQMIDVAQRLGEVLARVRRKDAIALYRDVLLHAPEERGLVDAMVALLRPDDAPQLRAEALEHLLAVSSGSKVAQIAAELVKLWQSAEDEEGVRRVLELAYQRDSRSDTNRERLESWYRNNGLWQPLVALLQREAQRREDPLRASSIYEEAAELAVEKLSDFGLAVQLFREAREGRPQDLNLLLKLSSALEHDQRVAEAIAEVSDTLDEGGMDADTRVRLLRMRASLYAREEEHELQLQSLEEAVKLDRSVVVDELIDALGAYVERMRTAMNDEEERKGLLRLVALLLGHEQSSLARPLVADWLERHLDDTEAWRLRLQLAEASDDEDEVIAVSRRLVELEEGAAQLEAVTRLADKLSARGQPDEAIGPLEQVLGAQPDNMAIRSRLAAVYRDAGDMERFVDLLLAGAEQVDDPEIQLDFWRQAGSTLITPLANHAAAITPLSKALALRPEDHNLILMLVDAYIETERLGEASEALVKAIGHHKRRRSPELAVLQHRMAVLARLSDDRDIEMEWLQAALATDKNNGEVASDLAWLAIDMGELDVALQALRAVTLMRSEGPMSRGMAFLLQARIAHQRGELRRAILWARKAVSEDEALEEAKEFLAELEGK